MTEKKQEKIVVRSEKEWKEIIKKFEESDLNRKNFCEKKGLNLATFHRWYAWINNPEKMKRKKEPKYKKPAPINASPELNFGACGVYTDKKALAKYKERVIARKEHDLRKQLKEIDLI